MDFTVIRSGDQYYVSPAFLLPSKTCRTSSPYPALVQAGLSRTTLRRRSARQARVAGPAEIKNQCLLVNQPSQLPVVVFACQRWQQRGNAMRFKAAVLLIDKRSGRPVYAKELDNPMGGIFHVVGNGEKKTMDVVMQQKTVKLTFTDKPIPPRAAAGAKPTRRRPTAIPPRPLGIAQRLSFPTTTSRIRTAKRHNESNAQDSPRSLGEMGDVARTSHQLVPLVGTSTWCRGQLAWPAVRHCSFQA